MKSDRGNGERSLLESAECWVIVNFKKSRWSQRDGTTFYINVAATSKRWLGIENKPADTVPHFYSCDWQWRVEHLGPDKNARQWTLSDRDSLQLTLLYLQTLFGNFVLPAIKRMTKEGELLRHSGGFEYSQLKTRSVILAATNDISALKLTVSTLIEKFGSGVVAKATRKHLENCYA